MNQFMYNEHGVCENPILKTHKCLKGYEAQINVAIVQNEMWSYSIAFKGQDQGWSQPLIYHAQYTVFNTKDEAYIEGVKLLLKQVTDNDYKNRYKAIIEMLEDELSPVVQNQLSLF